jgi:uncharacterized NAD-dependent epimerase/dehydratase family protein
MEGAKRTVIMAEGSFGILESKTASCVIRFSPDEVIAVLDSKNAGRQVSDVLGYGEGIPIFASIEETFSLSPTQLMIGIAPRGGKFPEDWRVVIRKAIDFGMDIVSGLHTFLGDDEEFASLAGDKGIRIWDIRKPPSTLTVGLGRARDLDATVILTVGTDCDVGKMTVSYELYRAALKCGLDAGFVATGQTGVYLYGKGTTVDSVTADYISGAVEEMVLDEAKGRELVIVEGQGSLVHPGYSAVTLGLIHGSMPDGFILCHLPTRTEVKDYGIPLPGLTQWIELYKGSMASLKEVPVLGIALNCFDLETEETDRVISRAEEETGLPATDPMKFGVDKLIEPIRKVVTRG